MPFVRLPADDPILMKRPAATRHHGVGPMTPANDNMSPAVQLIPQRMADDFNEAWDQAVESCMWQFKLPRSEAEKLLDQGF